MGHWKIERSKILENSQSKRDRYTKQPNTSLQISPDL